METHCHTIPKPHQKQSSLLYDSSYYTNVYPALRYKIMNDNSGYCLILSIVYLVSIVCKWPKSESD